MSSKDPAFQIGTPSFAVRLRRNSAFLFAVFAFLYFLAGLVTLDDQHNWGGDFSLYVAEARTLVEKGSLLNPYFVHNEKSLWHSPKSYPPLFPIMLTPVILTSGIDVSLLKIPPWITLLVSLFGIFFLFRQVDSPGTSWAVVLLFAVSPYVWGFRHEIMSEFPFIMASTLGLYASFHRRSMRYGDLVLRCIGTGLLIFAAYMTRTVTLVLMLSVFVFDVVQTTDRKGLVRTLVTGGTFLVAVLIYKLLIVDPGYEGSSIGICLSCAPSNFASYYKSLNAFLIGEKLSVSLGYFGYVFSLVTCVFIVGGFASAIKSKYETTNRNKNTAIRILQSASPIELYFVGTILLLLILPFSMVPRYLLPIFPFAAYYVVLGMRFAARRFAGRERLWIWGVASFLAIYLAGYASSVWFDTPRSMRVGVATAETQKLFGYIAATLSDDDLMLVGKPRVFALFTRKRATRWNTDVTPTKLLADIDRRRVTHLVLGKAGSDLLTVDWMLDHRVIRANFVVIYEDRLYRVLKYSRAKKQ